MPRYKVHYSFTDEDYVYINAVNEHNAKESVESDLEGYKTATITKIEEIK